MAAEKKTVLFVKSQMRYKKGKERSDTIREKTGEGRGTEVGEQICKMGSETWK